MTSSQGVHHFEYVDQQGYKWRVTVDTVGETLSVWCEDEGREYDLPHKVASIIHDEEYLYITGENGNIAQYKFEYNQFFVGDLTDKDGEHLEELAMWVFGEDNESDFSHASDDPIYDDNN
jgi:hypothetical protein